jgi:hypothetical protein
VGKSSSQANTTTQTTYTTNTTTNVGLSSADVSNIVNDFAQFALADQQLNMSSANGGSGFINGGAVQQSDPSADVPISAIPTQYIIIGIAALALLFLLR